MKECKQELPEIQGFSTTFDENAQTRPLLSKIRKYLKECPHAAHIIVNGAQYDKLKHAAINSTTRDLYLQGKRIITLCMLSTGR